MPTSIPRVHRIRVRVFAGAVAALAAASALSAAAREPIRAPASDWDFRQVESYVELDPIAEYQHASEAAYEAFGDWKYGVRIR